MEQGFLHRSLWTSENKFPHHHIMDFFTSVEVTQDIPKGTAFGPCVLHNTFYDTIAFIALKSFDKRNKSYVFRADPEAMKGSPLVVPWLRLVQAAMSTEDQNTEAFLKSGQLHFQTIRDIKQGEELLVWYDEELSNLLGFGDIKTKAFTDGFKCLKCGQIFKHEFPFLAHSRFLCHQDKVDSTNSDQKQAEVKRPRKVIDFHNIARDLEHKINTSPEDAEFPRKRRHETSPSPRHKKTVLLEKTNISNHENTDDSLHQTVTEQAKNSKLFKHSAFTEVKKPNESSPRDVTPSDVSLQSDCSAFTFVLPKRVHADPKSAFCEPIKHAFTDPDNISGAFKPNSSPEYRNVLASNLFPGELSAGVMSPPHPSSFFHAPEQWTRATGAPLQSSSLTLLPPTFTPLGVSVQNWCAKCNLSFRMTSDLVFHMRSHHKKEFAAEAQVRRRREEKLTCPICHEYFRERHHLSRHMTSHS